MSVGFEPTNGMLAGSLEAAGLNKQTKLSEYVLESPEKSDVVTPVMPFKYFNKRVGFHTLNTVYSLITLNI